MKKSTINLISGTLLSAGETVLAMNLKQNAIRDAETLEDTNMKNSTKIDQIESVDADKVPKEKGLTQLDSTCRSEWIANGFLHTQRNGRVGKGRSEFVIGTFSVKINLPGFPCESGQP